MEKKRNKIKVTDQVFAALWEKKKKKKKKKSGSDLPTSKIQIKGRYPHYK
jgi:hypothetical protein